MNLHRLRRRLRQPLEWAGYRVLQGAMGFIPYRRLPGLSRLFGAWLSHTAAARNLVLPNLQVAFPEQSPAERQALFRSTCRNMILTFLEFHWFSRHPDRLMQIVELRDPEAQAALAEGLAGRSALFLTPHLGNWELAGQVLAAHGVPMSAVAARIKNPAVARLVTRARTRHGLALIPEKGAARGILEAIRAGKVVGMLIDQNTRPARGGVFVPFFGLPATASRAPAAFARKCRIDVRIGAMVRVDGRLTVRMENLPQAPDQYASDEELTAAMMSAHERLIRRFPEQYLWFYERWRYIPADTPDEIRRRFPPYARPVPAA